MDLLAEISTFFEELTEFSPLINSFIENEALPIDMRSRAAQLLDILTEKVGYLGNEIVKLSGLSSTIRIEGKEVDIWSVALGIPISEFNEEGLGVCIHSTRRALGRLKSDIKNGLRDEKGNLPNTKSVVNDNKELVVPSNENLKSLFDSLKFNTKIVEVSRQLFFDGHYAQAIFEAFKLLEEIVREKSGCTDLFGKNLMAHVFNEKNPKIRVLEGGEFDEDVQEGFKFLFMGASQGIRNYKAHHNVIQQDPFITLEYLGFASFLLKRIDSFHVQKEH